MWCCYPLYALSNRILFTLHLSLANPDKQGVWRGEEFPQLFTTLHLFSPVSVHLKKMMIAWRIVQNRVDLPDASFMGSRWGLGEEWWRVVKSWAYSSPRQTPCLSGGRGMGEEWRVFHDSIVYSILGIKNPRGWSCAPISYGRFYYAVWTANWQIWRQLAVLGKTVNCSSSDS